LTRPATEFFRFVDMILETAWRQSGLTPAISVGAEDGFKGILDLIEMKLPYMADETLGAEWDVVEIPPTFPLLAIECLRR